ncbi:MAG: DNA-binding protein YbiB, partial [Burkholderiaceae bacterium]|nr:DNA-binding protein YbiB [Burkholderiaceae bacterium]
MNTSIQIESNESFPAARFIKEIGRGKNGARDMSRADAEALYGAMLVGRVSEVELGAVLLAMRIKGESVDEIAGFLAAAEASFAPLAAPAGPYAPIVIPSYNGARKMANLTALLALLLAREGVPVLVHGPAEVHGRVTSTALFSELGIPAWPGQYAPVLIPSYNGARKMATLTPLLALLLAREGVPVLVHGVTDDPGRVTTAEIFQ